MQIGAAGHVDGDHLALAAAHCRQVIVVAQRREYILRRDVVGAASRRPARRAARIDGRPEFGGLHAFTESSFGLTTRSR